MRVLVVGSGGREHALAWKIASDERVESVYAAPGSDGMAPVATASGVAADDIDGLVVLARERGIDLTVVGPEVPLAAGLVDRFQAEGLRAFGPRRDGAQLEASKAFTKRLLIEAGVATAAYGEFHEPAPARAFAAELGFPCVVKADGLAAGKGVVICADQAEADAAIASMLEGHRFGEAGARIVVEEFLAGEEASFMAITDGTHVLPLASSQDHKAVFDGDGGPNTGGMGAYAPAPVVTAALSAEIVATVIQPTVDALRGRGIDYRGILYAGLMIEEGRAKVLEYNCRFGDPECQPIMTRLETSLVDLMDAAIDGCLGGVEATYRPGASVCVVMASEGYPGDYPKGVEIRGLDDAAGLDGVEVFHAGTRRETGGRWTTAGGRVLGVTGLAPSVAQAARRAYEAVDRIHFDGAHFRTDIAHRAIEREAARGPKTRSPASSAPKETD